MSFFSTITRAAIAFIVTIALADATHAASGSCKGAAHHLVSLIKDNWPSWDENTAGATATSECVQSGPAALYFQRSNRYIVRAEQGGRYGQGS